MDFTGTDVAVSHPNPEQEDLPASPVLMVATVDGILRFYTFSHVDKASARLVQPPRPVPAIFSGLLRPGRLCAMGFSMTQDANSWCCQKWEKGLCSACAACKPIAR